MVSPAKVALPAPSVVAVAFDSVPLPEVIDAVTVTLGPVTVLPLASRSWMAGCIANAAPLDAEAEGCVMMASTLPAPAVPVAENTALKLPAVAVNVLGPAVVP